MKRTFIRLFFALIIGLPTTWVHAQDDSPIKIIVGYGAGGATDVTARFFADRLRVKLGRPVIVDNRPGGTTLIANRAVAAAKPDGKTYLIGPMSSTIFRELLYSDKARGYSLLTDLAPVATLSTYPMGFVVSGSIGVSNVVELLEWIKKNPDQASFGSSSLGSHSHALGILFNQATGVRMEVVPYKSNSEIITALIGAQLPLAVLTPQDWRALEGSDKLRVIGTFSEKRSPLMPETPTLAEQGVKATGGDAWMGMWAPSNTPADQVAAMQDAIEQVLKDPETVRALQQNFSADPFFIKGAEMDKRQRAEMEMWREVIKTSGFSAQS